MMNSPCAIFITPSRPKTTASPRTTSPRVVTAYRKFRPKTGSSSMPLLLTARAASGAFASGTDLGERLNDFKFDAFGLRQIDIAGNVAAGHGYGAARTTIFCPFGSRVHRRRFE